MFNVYAVRIIEGEKQRVFIGAFPGIEEAKHLANCATCGNAAYAYVKDSSGGTVFYLKAINPDEAYPAVPLECCRPLSGQPPQQ